MEEENWEIVVYEKYKKARKLMKENLSNEAEPFQSQYAAKEILKEMKNILSTRVPSKEDEEESGPSKIKIMTASMDYLLGTIHVEVDELSEGERYLNACLNELDSFELDPSCCLTVIGNLNQLGILWASLNQPKKSRDYLRRAELLYDKYKKEIQLSPTTMTQLFSNIAEEVKTGDKQLEKMHTITLYYLAQVYSTLDDSAKSAMYCHITLKRQLKDGNYDEIDWALNAATLSQYFISKEQFPTALHHLACASYVITRFEEKLKGNDSGEINDKVEQLKHRIADIARCWAKYGLLLLNSSHEHLMSATDDPTDDSSYEAFMPAEPAEKQSHLLFPALEVTSFEQQIRDTLVLDYTDAREVFLNAKKWLDEAKLYYTLNDHASDYVEIEQEMSKLYKALINFESDNDRQCKMYKRCVDILEAVLKELNPQYYMMICRQLMFEIAETYSEMMDIKKTIIEESGTDPSVHASAKIQLLIGKSIEHYTGFIDSVKDKKTNELPEKLADDVVRPTLIAHFRVGRLVTKISSPDRKFDQLNLISGMEYFKYVVDYLTRVPEHMDQAKTEFDVCKEMANLLAMKIRNMRIAS